MIDEESDRLNRFIEGLSTPDTEPVQPIRLRAIDVDEFIKSGLHRAETVTRDHHMVVSVEEAIPSVTVDAASITEVIYILLDNASKYAPAGTTITVNAAREDERTVESRWRTKGRGSPSICVSACSTSSSAYRPANRTIRVAAESASACPSRAGLWRHRAAAFGSTRPRRDEARPSS